MLTKHVLKTKQVTKVTFVLPEDIKAKTAHLVGDFNKWDETATPMTRMRDGRFKVTLNLRTGQEYEFRYLINGTEWHNDWNADKYVPHPFSGDNSIVVA